MWCHRFMRRHRLSVRAVTSVDHKLPVDWEEKMASFKLFVENAKSDVELEHIGNMDEVPVSFHITINYTVDEKRFKTSESIQLVSKSAISLLSSASQLMEENALQWFY